MLAVHHLSRTAHPLAAPSDPSWAVLAELLDRPHHIAPAATVEHLAHVLDELGAVDPHVEWATWLDSLPSWPEPTFFASASRDEAAMFLTALVRTEACVGGALLPALADGTLRAAVDRLRS